MIAWFLPELMPNPVLCRNKQQGSFEDNTMFCFRRGKRIQKYQVNNTQPGTKSTDLRVRVENKLTVRSITSVFLRFTSRHKKWTLAWGTWLESLLPPTPIICRVAPTLTDLSYLLWCCASKREKPGFETQCYSIKLINHFKNLLWPGKKFK